MSKKVLEQHNKRIRKLRNRSYIRKAHDDVLRITSQTAMRAIDLTFASYRNDKKEIKSCKDGIHQLFGYSNDAEVIIQWAIDTGKEITFLERVRDLLKQKGNKK
jgi:hypothetical protein